MNLLLSPTYMIGVVELLDFSDNTLLAFFFFSLALVINAFFVLVSLEYLKVFILKYDIVGGNGYRTFLP